MASLISFPDEILLRVLRYLHLDASALLNVGLTCQVGKRLFFVFCVLCVQRMPGLSSSRRGPCISNCSQVAAQTISGRSSLALFRFVVLCAWFWLF
jgi:hypothetical protein